MCMSIIQTEPNDLDEQKWYIDYKINRSQWCDGYQEKKIK